MKAWVKGIIAGAVIAAIGVAVFIGGLWLNGWKMPNANYNFEMKAYASENRDLNVLSLDIDIGTVRTEFYDGETITVDYPECDAFGYSITENDGTLVIVTVDNSFWHWFSWMPVNVPETVIKLPKDKIYDTQVKLDAGNVKLADGNYGNVKMNLDAGNVYVETMTCKALDIKLDAGSVKAGNIVCGDFYARLSAGTVEINEITANGVVCDMSAGTVKMTKIVSPETSFKASAGTIKAGFAGEQSEYNINVNKSAGTCNVDTATGTTEKKIYVKISAGTVKLDFAEG